MLHRTMVVFVLPVVFSFKLRGAEMGLPEKLFGVVCIITGLAGGSIGSYEAINDIIAKFQAGDIQ